MKEIEKNIENMIKKSGYDYFKFNGCFDIVARRKDNLILIKMLRNVDSIQEKQAANLKAAASSIDAKAVLVGEKTRRENLENDIIYERLGIPTFSIETLQKILFNDMPFFTRARGGIFIEIDAKMLKEKRKSAGLSQKELALKTGTSKKNIYEHEKQNKKAKEELVRKIERLIGRVTVPTSLSVANSWIESQPMNDFERKVSNQLKSLGFETSFVYKAPFNIAAKCIDITILSEAEENSKRLQNMSEEMKMFSETTKKPLIAITKEKIELEIPSISESELKKYSKKDIKKLVKNA